MTRVRVLAPVLLLLTLLAAVLVAVAHTRGVSLLGMHFHGHPQMHYFGMQMHYHGRAISTFYHG